MFVANVRGCALRRSKNVAQGGKKRVLSHHSPSKSSMSCQGLVRSHHVVASSSTPSSSIAGQRIRRSFLSPDHPLAEESVVSGIRNNFPRFTFQRRTLSSEIDAEPIIDTEALQSILIEQAPEISQQLSTKGYYTATNLLPPPMISLLRSQSVALRNKGRFEQSWSEKIVDDKAVRFDKEGVFACEPDGQDYYDAPDLIVYMSVLLQTLPEVLNGQTPTADVNLSNSSFNAKLAVTLPGGSKYPLHIDNPQGLSVGDTRKLTCILYLNPEYQQGDGGELRIFLPSGNSNEEKLEIVDLTPEGGRVVMFWSDEIPHEVLATAPDGAKDDDSLDRYALTVWIPTTNVTKLHNESSKFRDLKDLAFP